MSPKFIFEKTELLTSFKYNVHIEKCTNKSDVCTWALERVPLRSDRPLPSAAYESAPSHTISNSLSLPFLILTNLKGDSSNLMQFNFHFCEWAFATCLKDIFLLLCMVFRWLFKVLPSPCLSKRISGVFLQWLTFPLSSARPLPPNVFGCLIWSCASEPFLFLECPLLSDFSMRPLVPRAHLSEFPSQTLSAPPT